MLNVTGLFFPSHPKSAANFTSMGASFAPQADFQMDVWMGWDAGQAPHRLALRVAAPIGLIATFQYRNEFAGDPVIRASVTGQSFSMPAPPPGIHQFTISRSGSQMNFHLNGSPFASFSGVSESPAFGLSFDFVGPFPGDLGDFHIDQVQVIPAPGAVLLIPAFLVCRATRRRT
jgi:hypothetical protein